MLAVAVVAAAVANLKFKGCLHDKNGNPVFYFFTAKISAQNSILFNSCGSFILP